MGFVVAVVPVADGRMVAVVGEIAAAANCVPPESLPPP
jgi:hypothetical protein